MDGKFNSESTRKKMFLGKSKPIKAPLKKSTLDQILWLLENYLPNKKDRANRKEFNIYSLEELTIKQIKKFASMRSKSITPTQINTKFSFTVGNWALPFLKMLKKIGLIK